MRRIFQAVGLYLVVAGISGTIDHLAFQPIMGAFLNAFNRFALPHLGFLEGYEVFANLSLSVVGVIVIVAAEFMPGEDEPAKQSSDTSGEAGE